VPKKKSGNVIDAKNYKYDRIKYMGADGRTHYSAGNRDAIATALLSVGSKDFPSVAKANGISKLGKPGDYANKGQYRMALGHALRGLVRNGTPVKIGKHSVKTLKQKVALPK
jgi:hypothetical protein